MHFHFYSAQEVGRCASFLDEKPRQHRSSYYSRTEMLYWHTRTMQEPYWTALECLRSWGTLDSSQSSSPLNHLTAAK